MGYSGDAAEQIVRMSLNGIEIAAKISGRAAERLAVLIYAVLRDQKRTKGKVRLSGMMRSGKELKVFAVKDGELAKFCTEAKKYGVLYCVLKDNTVKDGLTDIMVKAEDASKVNRIFERFSLATVDMGSVKTTIEKTREQAKAGDIPEPVRNDNIRERVNEFLEKVVPQEEGKREKTVNPSMARQTEKSRSGNSSASREGSANEPAVPGSAAKPSVRKEMEEIRRQRMQEKPGGKVQDKPVQMHKEPARKRKSYRKGAR